MSRLESGSWEGPRHGACFLLSDQTNVHHRGCVLFRDCDIISEINLSIVDVQSSAIALMTAKIRTSASLLSDGDRTHEKRQNEPNGILGRMYYLDRKDDLRRLCRSDALTSGVKRRLEVALDPFPMGGWVSLAIPSRTAKTNPMVFWEN